ncbi:MAG TPA: hypothetical protein VF049_04675 [Nocardioidaceae bacterium]|jgi:hypothetical protein
MIWILVLVAVVLIVAGLEWRSRYKPLPPGLRDDWSVHSAAHNEARPMTGGADLRD